MPERRRDAVPSMPERDAALLIAMTPPRWIIPLEHGPLAVGGPRIEISITEDLDVALEEFGPPMLRRMPSLVAVQLGAAIQSAAAVWAGQEKARREMRRSKR